MLKLQKRSALVIREDSSSSSGDDGVKVARRGPELDLNLDVPRSTFQTTLQEINELASEQQRGPVGAAETLDTLGEEELGQGAGVFINDAEVLDVDLHESSDSDDMQARRPLDMGFDGEMSRRAESVSSRTDSNSDADTDSDAPMTVAFPDDTLDSVIRDVNVHKKRSFINQVSLRHAVDGIDSDDEAEDRDAQPVSPVPSLSQADRYKGRRFDQ